MDTNLLTGTHQFNGFALIGSAASSSSNLPTSYPVGTKAGDLAIIHQMDHDNGNTTTPGTTANSGVVAGWTVIDSSSDPGGSDDMDSQTAFKVLTSADVLAGPPQSGGASGGDSFFDIVHVLRFDKTINSVNKRSSVSAIDNLEGALAGIDINITLTGYTATAGTLITLVIASILTTPYGDGAAALTPLNSGLSDTGWIVAPEGGQTEGRLLFTSTKDAAIPALTAGFTSSTDQYVINLATLEIT